MNVFDPKQITEFIKTEAQRLGFFSCGISKARRLDEEEIILRRFIESGKHGDMHYLEKNFEMRLDPRLLMPCSVSVISLLHAYFPSEIQENDLNPVISKYAYGEDYHVVVKEKLYALADSLKTLFPHLEYRCFTDSAPILEKKWAENSGLGWIGKNMNLIVPKHGSFFFIGEITVNIELVYDEPMSRKCASCTRCIDACPTGALSETEGLDAQKCISYLTIEQKSEIPEHFKNQFQNRLFGCDICQDVCPHNSKAPVHNEPRFLPVFNLNKTLDEWNRTDSTTFNAIFRKSPLKRIKYSGFLRNLRFIQPE